MWDKISFISHLNPVGQSCNVDGGECAFEDKSSFSGAKNGRIGRRERERERDGEREGYGGGMERDI